MENYLKKIVFLLGDSKDNEAESAMMNFIETLKNLGYDEISIRQDIDRNSDLYDVIYIDFLEFAEGSLESRIENVIFQSKGMAVEIVYFNHTAFALDFTSDFTEGKIRDVNFVKNDLTQLKIDVTERLGKENQGSLKDASFHCFFIPLDVKYSLLSKNLDSLSDDEVWQIWKNYKLIKEFALIADEEMFQNFIKRVYELRLKNIYTF